MPTYNALPVLDKINAVVDLHQKKPLSEEQARATVGKILTTYSKLGIENAKDRLKYVEETRASAKKMLETMERLLGDLEAPNYIPEIYKLHEIKAGRDIIKALAKGVHDDGATMFDLMSQYRANWTPTVSKVCTDVGFVDSHIALRTQSMILGKKSVALVERIDEYVKRAEQVVKQAEKARSGAERDSKEAVSEADDLLKLMQDAADSSIKKMTDTERLVKRLEGTLTQSTYTGKEHKVAESVVQDIETARKAIAGLSKTSQQNLVRLQALVKEWAFILKAKGEKGAKAAQEIKDHLTTAEKNVVEAKNLLKKLEKRVGK